MVEEGEGGHPPDQDGYERVYIQLHAVIDAVTAQRRHHGHVERQQHGQLVPRCLSR